MRPVLTRRTLVGAALAVAAAQLVVPQSAQAAPCEPGGFDGWVIGNFPGTPMPQHTERSYRATADGAYAGVGAWKLTIDRPLSKKKIKRIVITSPPDGRPDHQPRGVIKKNDVVRGYSFASPAGFLVFGDPCGVNEAGELLPSR